MKSAPAGKPPPRRRGRSLPDLLWGNMAKAEHDPTPAPPVTDRGMREKMHPIQHSSPN